MPQVFVFAFLRNKKKRESVARAPAGLCSLSKRPDPRPITDESPRMAAMNSLYLLSYQQHRLGTEDKHIGRNTDTCSGPWIALDSASGCAFVCTVDHKNETVSVHAFVAHKQHSTPKVRMILRLELDALCLEWCGHNSLTLSDGNFLCPTASPSTVIPCSLS